MYTPEPQRPLTPVIERSPPARVIEPSERYPYARAEIKRSMIIGGAMFVLLIILYVLFG